jgi:hypothetical protein
VINLTNFQGYPQVLVNMWKTPQRMGAAIWEVGRE